MAKAGIKTLGDIRAMELERLKHHFGSFAQRLHELARGIDHNPVVSNRVRKQVSAEDTFPEDIPLMECERHIRRLAQKVWEASQGNARQARTAVLKLKTKEFSSLTRSLTSRHWIPSCEELTDIALSLCGRVDLPAQQLYRLVSVGLSNFRIEDETDDAATRDSVLPVSELLLQAQE